MHSLSTLLSTGDGDGQTTDGVSISGASVRESLTAATLDPTSGSTVTLTNGRVLSTSAVPAFKLRHEALAKATNATSKLNGVASGLLNSADAIKGKVRTFAANMRLR